MRRRLLEARDETLAIDLLCDEGADISHAPGLADLEHDRVALGARDAPKHRIVVRIWRGARRPNLSRARDGLAISLKPRS